MAGTAGMRDRGKRSLAKLKSAVSHNRTVGATSSAVLERELRLTETQ